MTKKSVKKTYKPVMQGEKADASARKPLVKAPEEQIFWCNDGCTFTDLRELARGLAAMSDDTFFYHADQANRGKNDFSIWVKEVIGDVELADALEKATSRGGAAACVIARLEHSE